MSLWNRRCGGVVRLLLAPTLVLALSSPSSAQDVFDLPEDVLSRPPRDCEEVPQFVPRSVWNANLWTGGIVPYQFNANTDASMQNAMRAAMDELEAVCNVTFVVRSGQSNYINIQDSSGNNSAVGMVGGSQTINIFNWNYRFIMCHELMHALGVWHEQSRSDRATFVTINYANVCQNCCSGGPCDHNFNIIGGATPVGTYDFDSVMHYGATAFSVNGQPTIQTTPAYAAFQNLMGQRDHLSQGDRDGLISRYGAATNTEVEPNDSKAQATVISNGGAGLTSGQTITGNSTSASGAGLDYFRVKTAPAALGIYRHQLALTSTGPQNHTGTIRGLTQTAGVVNAGTDATFQTSSGSTTPARMNQWFGFGKQEEIYYRVSGDSTTTSNYVATLTTTPVTPTIVPDVIGQGSVTISTVSQTTVDTDFWVYDASLNPVATFGNDDEFGTSSLQSVCTRTLNAGTYYIAVSNYNSANDQPSPSDDDFRTGAVLDFPNAYANTSTSTALNCNISITSIAGTALVSGTKTGPFDVVWYRFTVVPPTNPGGSGSVAAGPHAPGETLHIAVTVVNGTLPTSTFALPASGVKVNANALGVGPGLVSLFDDGLHSDGAAGDGVWGADVTITLGAPGVQSLPLTVTDDQGRTGNGSVSVLLGENLGSLAVNSTTVIDRNYAAGQIRWFKFTIPNAAAAPNRWLDVWTYNGAAPIFGGTSSDTEVGIFGTDGSLFDNEDDLGPLNGGGANHYFTCLSYGRTDAAPARPRDGSTKALGGDGAMSAGTRWITVAGYNAVFSGGFGVTTTSSQTGNIALKLNYGQYPPPCAADVNNSGTLSVQDLFDFLAAYFGDQPIGDFNNSGSRTVQDLFDFLAAYFGGCTF